MGGATFGTRSDHPTAYRTRFMRRLWQTVIPQGSGRNRRGIAFGRVGMEVSGRMDR